VTPRRARTGGWAVFREFQAFIAHRWSDLRSSSTAPESGGGCTRCSSKVESAAPQQAFSGWQPDALRDEPSVEDDWSRVQPQSPVARPDDALGVEVHSPAADFDPALWSRGVQGHMSIADMVNPASFVPVKFWAEL
jgi:hypothetical protein